MRKMICWLIEHKVQIKMSDALREKINWFVEISNVDCEMGKEWWKEIHRLVELITLEVEENE